MKTRVESKDAAHMGSLRVNPIILGIAAILVISTFAASPVKGASFNAVQVFVNTSSQLNYAYTFTAYNSSGNQVASYQTGFPAAAFELPAGEYLFTVSAVYEQGFNCYLCPVYGGAGTPGSVSGTTAGGNGTAKTPYGTYPPGNSTATVTSNNYSMTTTTVSTSPPYRIAQPESEYGWALVKVDSSQSLSIDTVNVTKMPAAHVTVSVAFENGTAAAGASVSASVVGQWYYWWASGENISMWGKTGTDGSVTLTLPTAPLSIAAWDWIPVNLPANETTTVDIGGQKVNVTEVWGPAYVGLSGSTTLIPHSTRANITLQYQEAGYWAIPMSAQTAPAMSGETSSGVVADAPSGVPASVRQTTTSQSGQNLYYQPAMIGALGAAEPRSGGSPLSPSTMTIVAAAAIAVATISAAAILAKRRSPPTQTAA